MIKSGLLVLFFIFGSEVDAGTALTPKADGLVPSVGGRDLKLAQEGVFKNGIAASYVNETGLIVIDNDKKAFWVENGSSTAYEIITEWGNGRGVFAGVDFETRNFDPRLPTGGYIMQVHQNEIRISNLVFRKNTEISNEQLNTALALRGIRKFMDRSPNPADLNLWDYTAFSNGEFYFVVAMHSTSISTYRSESNVVRFFAGTKDSMMEVQAYFNRELRKIVLPTLQLSFGFSEGRNYPLYDPTTNAFMGRYSEATSNLDFESLINRQLFHHPVLLLDGPQANRLTSDPKNLLTNSHSQNSAQSKNLVEAVLAILNGESNSRPVEVPKKDAQPSPKRLVFPMSATPVDLETSPNFSIVSLLGSMIRPPVVWQTPMDSLVGVRNQSFVQGDNSSTRGLTSQEQQAKIRKTEGALRQFSDTAKFLENPVGDPKRELAEIVIGDPGNLERISSLVKQHASNDDFASAFIVYLKELRDWNLQKLLMPALSYVLMQQKKSVPFLVSFVAVTLRYLPHGSNEASLERIISWLYSLNIQGVSRNLDNTLGKPPFLPARIENKNAEVLTFERANNSKLCTWIFR